MRASASNTEATRGRTSWRRLTERFLLPIPDRLRDGRFWIIQGLLAAITAFHITGEVTGLAESYGSLRHVPVMLYVIPVIYAALRFGVEGGLLTGLWSFALSAPNLTIWHRDELEGEIGLLALVIGIGLALAWRVEREATLRRQAEATGRELRQSKDRLQFYLSKITDAQEAERQRVARELHDDTIQSLVLVGRNLDAIIPEQDGSVSSKLRQQVEVARAQLDAAIDGARRLARDLRPSILDRLGLVPSIEWLLSDLSKRRGLKTNLEIEGEVQRLPPDVELCLFRIVQESLRNVEAHSGATTVEVVVHAGDERLQVRIDDDGGGFDVGSVLADEQHNGLGLQGMRERAQLLGGRVDIESVPSGGTSVLAAVPVQSA